MQYLALLIRQDRDLTPDEQATEMAAYQSFHAKAGAAIRSGDALLPAAVAVRVSGGPDAPTITDGPFAEGAEVAGGFYVFEAENLDDALELARGIPAARYGAIEVRPIFHTIDEKWSRPDAGWLALLLEPPEGVNPPGTPEWQAEAGQHAEFAAAAGDHVVAGAALHEPATATTVRVRDGRPVLTDGPFAESAEIATGFYLLTAADRDEAVKLASMIPASVVEVRQLAKVSAV
jgi:hypothetical protein